MARLYRILYCSRPSPAALPAQHVDQILRIARQRNAANAITGGLLFSDGSFAQVLEGPLTSVSETFERIQQDDRHRNVTLLRAEAIRERDFPDWAMAYSGVGRPAGLQRWDGIPFAGHVRYGQETLDLLRSVIVCEDDRNRID